jgi:uncharacterized repeat protein (TIGR01451 family)
MKFKHYIRILLLFFLFKSVTSIAQNTLEMKWVKSWTNTLNTRGALATDNSGNIYCAGHFNSSTMDIDPGPGIYTIGGPGNNMAYLSKFDSTGNIIWAGALSGSTISDWVFCLSFIVDAQKNMIASGWFTGTADLNPGSSVQNFTSYGSSDVFVIKLDSLGNLLWAHQYGGTSNESGGLTALDDLGNIYLGGSFSGTANFNPAGTYNLISNGFDDGFINKMDPNGNFLWTRGFGGTGQDFVQKITIDKNRDVVISGDFNFTVDFDPGIGIYNKTSFGNSDVFVAKFNDAGIFNWVKQIGGSNNEYGNSIVTDTAGYIYYAAGYTVSPDFNPDTLATYYLANAPTSVQVIAINKLDINGNFIWSKKLEGIADGYEALTLALDKNANIYITGKFTGVKDFDPSAAIYNLTATAAGADQDAFICKLDNNGNMKWAKGFGSFSSDGGTSIALDIYDNLIIAGKIGGTVNFNFDPTGFYASPGWTGTYLCKYKDDICHPTSLNIINATNLSCSSSTVVIKAIVNYVTPPFSYTWATIPVSNADSLIINQPGVYTVSVTDSNSCYKSKSVYIDGPDTLTAFDLKANLIATPFRANLSSIVEINAFNAGCIPITGSLKIVKDSLLNYNSASPSPSSISGDTLIWNFSSMTFDSPNLIPSINYTTSITALIGDTVSLEVIMNPMIGDSDPVNNNKLYKFPVISSYDPNIKSVEPKGSGSNGNIGNNQKMTYTVQFQNTGNADAINIHVDDTIDTNLDLSSLHVIGYSHPMITEVLPENVLRFKYDFIYLPDSTTNEPLSHGYVIYEIDQKPNLPIGTQFFNTGYIYFDYNPAVVTNTTINTIEANGVTVESISEKSNAINIYPNPVKNMLTIAFDDETSCTISLTDIQGRIIEVKQTKQSDKVLFDVKYLSDGVYILNVREQNGRSTNYKIIKSQ